MDATNQSGWVLYDDDCDFCRRWVLLFELTLAKRGFGIAPLQADWVRDKLQLPEDELLQDVRLLLPDGDQIAGPDVYRYCMRRIWWTLPLWVFAALPLGRQAFDWSYRTFARNRYCVSAATRRS